MDIWAEVVLSGSARFWSGGRGGRRVRRRSRCGAGSCWRRMVALATRSRPTSAVRGGRSAGGGAGSRRAGSTAGTTSPGWEAALDQRRRCGAGDREDARSSAVSRCCSFRPAGRGGWRFEGVRFSV